MMGEILDWKSERELIKKRITDTDAKLEQTLPSLLPEIFEILDNFDYAPFTFSRILELSTSDQYKNRQKYHRALEKVVSVTSSVNSKSLSPATPTRGIFSSISKMDLNYTPSKDAAVVE